MRNKARVVSPRHRTRGQGSQTISASSSRDYPDQAAEDASGHLPRSNSECPINAWVDV